MCGFISAHSETPVLLARSLSMCQDDEARLKHILGSFLPNALLTFSTLNVR